MSEKHCYYLISAASMDGDRIKNGSHPPPVFCQPRHQLTERKAIQKAVASGKQHYVIRYIKSGEFPFAGAEKLIDGVVRYTAGGGETVEVGDGA